MLPPRYQPIENYGVVGNMHTVALISRHRASVDFFCYPDFDSPTLFCRLLDYEKGGYFEIMPSECTSTLMRTLSTSAENGKTSCPSFASAIRRKQLYLPSSNVLITRFSGKEGITQVTDLMPVRPDGSPSFPWLIRKVECIRGYGSMDVTIQPAFDYARSNHELEEESNRLVFESRFMTVDLRWAYCHSKLSAEENISSHLHHTHSTFRWQRVGSNKRPGAKTTFTLLEGQSVIFVLRSSKHSDDQSPLEADQTSTQMEENRNKKHVEMVPNMGKAAESEEAKKDEKRESEPLSFEDCSVLIDETLSFWHSWIAGCTYKGRWREIVHRSALLLKLLTYAPTGAIVAAPTFGLPEEIGGLLNWDYRFVWIRDAAFTVYAFLRIGFRQEAMKFMEFIEKRCQEIITGKRTLQVLYDIRGNSPAAMIAEVRARASWYEENILDETNTLETRDNTEEEENQTAGKIGDKFSAESRRGPEGSRVGALYLVDTDTEMTLPNLEGYCGSRPVRIGNAACNQMQSDIFGELMDAIYLVDKWARPISYDFWTFIRNWLIPQVLTTSSLPDHGIWELRHGQRHYTYSKVMAWVALDRAIRLAAKRSFPSDSDEIWRPARDALFEEIMTKGWSEERQAFVQYYESTDLDASSLVMPLVLFLSPLDPKFLATLKATLLPTRLGGLTANNLCFRWSPWVPEEAASSMMVMPSEKSAESLHSASSTGSLMVLRNEGTFNLCSFWLVEAMARAGSRATLDGNRRFLDLALLMFEDIIGYANHLGLFSEEISVCGQALGNFPQAFTHLALISAAFNIDRNLDDDACKGPE